MINVCISYTIEDKYIIKILKTLLEHHDIKTILREYNSKKNNKNDQDSFNDVDYLIVLLSNKSIHSKSIKSDIEEFQKIKKNYQVIFLLLDSIITDLVEFNTSNYQVVQFSECYFVGFKKLMTLFNKDFLQEDEKRSNEDRRAGIDRRYKLDRRQSIVDQRLRSGLWKSYATATGAGIYDYLLMESVEEILITEFLKREAVQYKYIDHEGQSCDAAQVVEKRSQKQRC